MEKNWLNKFSLIVDENRTKIQIGMYTVTLSGLLYALKSVRPFQKFQHAKEIPKSFFDRKLRLNGSVINIAVGPSVVLRVDHNPIFFARLRPRSNPGLAVNISSINVCGNGVSWLQNMLQGKNVRFTLLKRNEEQVFCLVYYNKTNVAEELVKLGFATVDVVDFDLENDKFYMMYYRSLLKLEGMAEKKNVGMWSNTEYSTLEKYSRKIMDILYQIYYRLRRK